MADPENAERLSGLSRTLRSAEPNEAWEVLHELLNLLGPFVKSRLRARFRLSAEECDDVLSSALVRLFETRGSLRSDGSLAGYFVRIADRLAIDLLRRPQPAATSELEWTPPARDPSDDRSAVAARVDAALRDLDPIDARILDAFSRSQDPDRWAQPVARELGLTPNAVRVRKHRALARLKEAYKTRHGVPERRGDDS